MKSFDSLSEYSKDSKPKKTQWDSLSSGSTGWDSLKEINGADSPYHRRPLDYPDDWDKLDLPHRDSYYGNSQNTSKRDSDSGDIDELLDIPLDDDLLEYIKNVSLADKTMTEISHDSKTEAVKSKNDGNTRRGQDLLDILDEKIEQFQTPLNQAQEVDNKSVQGGR